MARRLLERDQELATLLDAASVAAKGTGSVILLHGEAGIGKTSLVSAIRSQLPDGTRMLVGACDALSTPRTLGPFRDLTAAVGPRLAQALQAGERDLVMDALLDELQRPPPSTLVVEDVHWADEATIDTLRFLVRRIAQLPVVLLLTYRDDELSRDHPLTQLLGDASHANQVHHLSPQRLSEPAVRTLVAGSPLDAEEVYALSDGNPYFVNELVASAVGSSVPPTVVDAVLGRLGRLATAHQDTIELLAVVPSGLDRRLGEAVIAAAHPISRQRVTGARGRTLVDLPVSSIWGNGGQSVAIRRNALHELLRRQLPGSPFAVEPASPPDFAMARSSSATDRSNNTTYWSVPTEPIPWYAPLASEARRHSTPVAGAGASLLMAGAARKTPGALA